MTEHHFEPNGLTLTAGSVSTLVAACDYGTSGNCCGVRQGRHWGSVHTSHGFEEEANRQRDQGAVSNVPVVSGMVSRGHASGLPQWLEGQATSV